jgi:Na+-driven multidrug efflux pump
LTAFGSLFGITCSAWIAKAFTIDANLIRSITEGMPLALIMFAVVGFQIVATNFFQSIGQAGKSIFLSLSRQVLFMIPLLLILPKFWGLTGIWSSFPISDVFATIVTAVLIIIQFRKIANISR